MKTLIKNGTLVDDGRMWKADLRIGGDKIIEIGSQLPIDGADVIDVEGLCVCPGFIDAHRHIDAKLLSTPGYGEIELHQGITSAIVGNCGFSLFPVLEKDDGSLKDFLRPIVGPFAAPAASLADYLAKVDAASPAINAGGMLGNGSVRVALNGFSGGSLPESLLVKAEEIIDQALADGAFGLSMGLMYAPENEYGFPELLRLARAMRGRGVLAIHLRGEGRSLVLSVNEAISIARESGVPLVISHFKAAGCPASGPAYLDAKAAIERAHAEGIGVSVDVYPYAAGSTSITTLLPPSMMSGGIDALCKQLASAPARASLRALFDREWEGYDNLIYDIGFGAIRVASASKPENRPLVGKSIASIAMERGTACSDVIADLIVSERGETTIVNFIVAEENLYDALALPYAAYISDSLCGAALPHPRLYGAFARVLGHCVREKRLLSLPEAIRRMTNVPAERYGIARRGRLKTGCFADIVAFDPETVRDNATYESPCVLPDGIVHTWVNGCLALKDGIITGKLRGRALRRNQ